jgi:hypothetical protein
VINRDRNNLADVYKILDVTAGSSDESDNSIIYKMHLKKIAESIAYNAEVQEFNTGRINKFSEYAELREADSIENVWKDIVDYGEMIGDDINKIADKVGVSLAETDKATSDFITKNTESLQFKDKDVAKPVEQAGNFVAKVFGW